MNAHFAEITRGYVVADRGLARHEGKPVQGGRQSFISWLMDLPRRRAVINELDLLSDRELTDIGLVRGDVPRVFERGFTGSRIGN